MPAAYGVGTFRLPQRVFIFFLVFGSRFKIMPLRLAFDVDPVWISAEDPFGSLYEINPVVRVAAR